MTEEASQKDTILYTIITIINKASTSPSVKTQELKNVFSVQDIPCCTMVHLINWTLT